MDEFTFSRKRAVGLLKTVSYEKNVCVNIFFETTFFKKIERSRENTCVILSKLTDVYKSELATVTNTSKCFLWNIFVHGINIYAEL